MSPPLLIALGVASTIVSLAALVGAIWLAGRVWQVPDVSWRRAVQAVLWLTLASVVLLPAVLFVASQQSDSANITWVLLQYSILMLVELGLTVPCIGRPLRTGAIKAICVGLTAYAGHAVVALGLAMACRHTLVEGFVIPTGAMAPTLYGAHFELTCPNCGHSFAASASQRAGGQPPRGDEIATCLHCNTSITISPDNQVASGDRIVVDKNVSPRRWDCVVFHEPSPARLNYVKRLVGLPGETIELVAGDVFVNGSRLRKHPHRQADLWLPWHDTKWVPRVREVDTPRWRPVAAESHWKEAGDGGWTFSGLPTASEALEFDGEISDDCEYNLQVGPAGPREYVPLGDLRVTCNVKAFSGPGKLQLIWQFDSRELRFSVSSAGAEIAIADGQLAASPSDKFIRPGEPFEFAVRDGTAYVLCGEQELSVDYLPASVEIARQESPEPVDFCRLQLVAQQCRVEISRLRIDRDIYYVSRAEMEQRIGFHSGEGSELSSKLGADEHMMLGDNVMASKDSRFFGPIRASDLIGVVRWRYWPQTRWHELD